MFGWLHREGEKLPVANSTSSWLDCYMRLPICLPEFVKYGNSFKRKRQVVILSPSVFKQEVAH